MTKDVNPSETRGAARCPGTSFDELIGSDSRPVPEYLAKEHYEYMGSEPLDAARYTSPAFFRLECEKMWPNVWQWAARDEDMPEPGDVVVYENAGRTYLVVRQDDGSVRAFHNVCLHRGRKLRTESGWSKEFKCPFHGFTWNRDGTIKEIPCRWDFSHLKEEAMTLPEAQVAHWGGYIFIRENDTGVSIEDYLAPLPEHLKRYEHEKCQTVAWVAKVVPANWKATAEAFMEAWHAYITHPQIAPFTGDWNTRYNVFGDHMNVALTPFGVPSPQLDTAGLSEQWIVDEFLRYNGRQGSVMDVKVPEGMTARKAAGAACRERYAKEQRIDLDHATDAELLDALTYNVFPNFAPWGGFMPKIVYRWRPWPDQDHTLMECRILVRVPEGEKAPRSVPMHMLRDDQNWSDATELGSLGSVFDQDMANLPYVQQGMKASKNGKIQLADYQEIRIRHFHRTLDRYLAKY